VASGFGYFVVVSNTFYPIWRPFHNDLSTFLLIFFATVRYIKDNKVISYIWQFLNRTIEWGGLYQEVKRGISRGSSLSPLLGAFYLLDLDQRLEGVNVKYFRYMDDVWILAPTRWKLREAIRVLNQTFSELRLEKHPDKTFIGRIDKGFDFLG
jgi:retron-type reverse transcriptase